jgi:hypothetical protein
MTQLSPNQLFQENIEILTRFGGCNLFAAAVNQILNLPCYMVYHKFIDYDDTGTRHHGEITISKDELNDFKKEYLFLKKIDPDMSKTSQPIGHCYFIDDFENKHMLCDGLACLTPIKDINHPECEIIDQFEDDFTNYNFDPKECLKITPNIFKIINQTKLTKFSSNSWETLFSDAEIEKLKPELEKYIKNKPWRQNHG